ncbi:hypothetical protein OIU93_20275 [Paeniglutamicibacter sp. ZC-3]|uniref:hypothetical protein n=1 Tax=Paeniglutamicibacter sp. ZC-3 TaxID=2986919 RepID=UPI0021F7E4E9|nr:hypothetical protein [Paeniglutamicibacter sp. ZC-3]MCV9996595.1 hypothetical protein [Paeniglutamicibacter sp. ZC-3]
MTRTLITQIAALVALIASIMLANDLNNLFATPWKVVLGSIAVLSAISLAIVEILGTYKSQPRRFKGPKRDAKILKYMIKLLKPESQCVISSNDLSWVDTVAEKVLEKKAKNNSLTLLMPVENDISIRLASKGAKVYYYGDDQFKFTSRFTLFDLDGTGPWVAIGHRTEEVHTIRKISSKDDPAIHLVNDLYRLMARHTVAASSE